MRLIKDSIIKLEDLESKKIKSHDDALTRLGKGRKRME